jgi:hypothetical protein
MAGAFLGRPLAQTGTQSRWQREDLQGNATGGKQQEQPAGQVGFMAVSPAMLCDNSINRICKTS